MPSPPSGQQDRVARERGEIHNARAERAAARDDAAQVRDDAATVRDDAAQVRDAAALTRDQQFLTHELRLRQLLTRLESRHAAERARQEQLAEQQPSGDERMADQAAIDRETRRSEGALDAADMSELRAGLDWLHDTFVRDTRGDRWASADDRSRSRSDRSAAGADRTAADAERQQSAVDEARHE